MLAEEIADAVLAGCSVKFVTVSNWLMVSVRKDSDEYRDGVELDRIIRDELPLEVALTRAVEVGRNHVAPRRTPFYPQRAAPKSVRAGKPTPGVPDLG